MKLLFDDNLSFKLCAACGYFPWVEPSSPPWIGRSGGSRQLELCRWQRLHARFARCLADRATLIGPPPKVIWLRCGHQPTENIGELLRDHLDAIIAFEHDDAACLEIY